MAHFKSDSLSFLLLFSFIDKYVPEIPFLYAIRFNTSVLASSHSRLFLELGSMSHSAFFVEFGILDLQSDSLCLSVQGTASQIQSSGRTTS